ncbi:MAG: hypothetical protein R2724_25010 [Bryobacterales bacterium]
MTVSPPSTREQESVEAVADGFKAMGDKHGDGVDIAIDFHGACVQPPLQQCRS